MTDRCSLLDVIKQGGFEASLISTFNCYFPFYENVVLRRLLAGGSRHNVLLMDSGQLVESVKCAPPMEAGRSYSLAPVKVPGAFHPKLILLVGRKKAVMAVGSHNMTLQGFGFNRELTNILQYRPGDDVEASLFSSAFAIVDRWLESNRSNLPAHVESMVQRVRTFADWIPAPGDARPGSTVELIDGAAGTTSIWSRVREAVSWPVESVVVTGAFFDHRLSFLERLVKDLSPQRCVVAVDPKTVALPSLARTFEGVDFVDADRFGIPKEAEGLGSYLHAKGLYVRGVDGQCVLVTGSANPSHPAWLQDAEHGNTELVVLRSGADALQAATALGFLELLSAQPLSENSWEEIVIRAEAELEIEKTNALPVHIAEFDDELLSLHLPQKFSSANAYCLDLVGTDEELVNPRISEQAETLYFKCSEKVVERVTKLRLLCDGKCLAEFLVHYRKRIEQSAQTGPQRQLHTALASLSGDSPDIAQLIEILERVIQSNEEQSPQRQKANVARDAENKILSVTYTSLAAEDDEASSSLKLRRLKHSSNLAYVIDALIYQLGLPSGERLERLDGLGRSEEEQIGEDDAEEDLAKLSQADQLAALDICHRKLQSLINRLHRYLDGLSKKEVDLEPALVRVMAVLGLLRTLRECDGKGGWVPDNKTAVPMELRQQLFEAVMLSLFEGPLSLINLSDKNPDLANTDDIARLRGLLMWLARDSGAAFRADAPFMEEPEERDKRLVTNAMLLALAQAAGDKELSVAELQQSLAGVGDVATGWVTTMRLLANIRDSMKHLATAEPSIGAFAFHEMSDRFPVRLVKRHDSKCVSLQKLCPDLKEGTFTTNKLSFAHFNDLHA